jgi:hypothetical protein
LFSAVGISVLPALARQPKAEGGEDVKNGLNAERFGSVVTTSDRGLWLSLNPIWRMTFVVVL